MKHTMNVVKRINKYTFRETEKSIQFRVEKYNLKKPKHHLDISIVLSDIKKRKVERILQV